MTRTVTTSRWLIALVAIFAALAFASLSAQRAQASGLTADHLADHGWTCFTPPPRPDLVACYNPAQGRPLPGDPDPAPTYSVRTFSSSTGEFLGTAHLLRADLYRGQPCGTGSYVFRGLIGYYECAHG
jgi:hypothetical protein